MPVPTRNLKRMTRAELIEHLGIIMDDNSITPNEAPEETEVLTEE